LKDAAAQKASELKEAASDKATQLKESASEKYDQGKEKANEAYEVAVQKGSEIKDNIKEKGSELSDEAQEEPSSILGRASAFVGSAVHAVQEKTSGIADSARHMLGLQNPETTTEVYEMHEKEVGVEDDGSIRVEKTEKWTTKEGTGPKDVKENTTQYVKPAE